MKRRYVAFDIETAKITAEPVNDVKALRPLGICCAATLETTDGEPHFWHGCTDNATPAPRMTPAEAGQIVRSLTELVDAGFTIVTWNGLGFDFDILAEESDMWDECRQLARDHVDMMFHIFCDRGYPISLDRAAAGMRLKGKSKAVPTFQVPQFWADGRTDEVLDYLKDDVRATLEIARDCERQRRLRWKTQRGRIGEMPLPSGWRTVREAMKLPRPDTSWMDKPLSRASFTDWIT